MKYLIDAGPGKHTVELSLHFTLIGDNIWDQPLYEHSATWISLPSHPLAVGSFDIEVPEGNFHRLVALELSLTYIIKRLRSLTTSPPPTSKEHHLKPSTPSTRRVDMPDCQHH